jgi:hypothetical protein
MAPSVVPLHAKLLKKPLGPALAAFLLGLPVMTC